MAERPVIWTQSAQEQRKAILRYWVEHNQTKTYAERLARMFESATETISVFPEIGTMTQRKHVRVKVVKDYLMFYKIQPSQIQILLIWDARRDPSRLPKGFKRS